MLRIQNISKKYETGGFIQKALDDVSLYLRDNEFVAILGPSGSGKTTLLNIIGGLDRYDDGDLIINDISTKEYTDRDWDSYRNHTIGFVFQSYNLIPHQSVLANVELALTISGISKEERRKRAMEALEKVGLADQAHKKPNQMSGGQMQRVAIARALVNDPDILLADEPTGALDSKTSIMVMDLLKEVAKDRLVVMVTHNPELAEEYATRIVNLQDGKIQSDSNPVRMLPHHEVPTEKKNMGHSSMSFLTALSLSFQNLWTKKARTLLTAFAGSIGIIGIAAILSLSTGVNNYIANVEGETLSEYPLEIQKTGISLGSAEQMMNVSAPESTEGGIRVSEALTTMFSTTDTNDLKHLKEFLESDQSQISQYAQAVEYSYGITPVIYQQDANGSVRKVNPDETFAALGFGSSSSAASMFSTMMSTNVFYEMPSTASLYETQYDVVAGRWPESYDECILVLSQRGQISDFLLYVMGLRDYNELENAIETYTSDEAARLPSYTDDIVSYDDILDVTFKLVPNADLYQYDSEYGYWVDKSEDEAYMENLVENGQTTRIVGIVKPSADANGAALRTGINYPFSLTQYIVEQDSKSEIVKEQLKNPDRNVFTGKDFDDDSKTELKLDSIVSFDADALSSLFAFDPSMLIASMDFSSALANMNLDAADLAGLIDFSAFDTSGLDIDQEMISDLNKELVSSLRASITTEQLETLAKDLLENYSKYIDGDTSRDYLNMASYFEKYLESEQARQIIDDALQDYLGTMEPGLTENLDYSQLGNLIASGFQEYMEQMGYTDEDPTAVMTYLQEYLSSQAFSNTVSQWLKDNIHLNTDPSAISALASKLTASLLDGYKTYAEENGYPLMENMAADFMEYLSSDSAAQIISKDLSGLEDAVTKAVVNYASQVGTAYGSALSQQISSQISSLVPALISKMQSSIQAAMQDVFSNFGSQMSSMMEISSDNLEDLFQFNLDTDGLAQLLAFSTVKNPSLESNLESLGYTNFTDPTEIKLYPYNFESKKEIEKILNGYNERMEEEGYPERVISYTDIVGTLMSSVTEIVSLISNVLIAFVSISLVVSSIMIGVITYISVLERQKEIGILRAMGASKRNISEVFNAETMLIGFASGIIGIGLTLILLIPANMLIHYIAGNNSMNAVLPIGGALVLIALSVILTLIGGLIPASKASKSNPVTALRTE